MKQQNSYRVHFIFSVDKRARINSWSKELENMFGRSSSEVQGIPYHEVIPKIHKGNTDAIMQAIKNGKPITLKAYPVTSFCGKSKATVRVIPRKVKKGKVEGADILISVHPSCAMWKRFKQSQRLVDIGKISATFAHGVRNPLNAIKGAVVYLREKYASEKKLIEFTKIIEDEISRLDNFIAQFLSASVSEGNLSEIDINTILKKIEVLTSLQAKSRKIETNYEYGYTHHVNINSFQLEHAILNIINNAMEAMPLGGQLSAKTRSDIRSGTEFAVVEISDTGSGMTMGKQNDMVVTSNAKGKGLGLFITREVLRSCGGHLEIESKRGLGTTVRLCVPTYKNG